MQTGAGLLITQAKNRRPTPAGMASAKGLVWTRNIESTNIAGVTAKVLTARTFVD
jgi:hypothetical protein